MVRSFFEVMSFLTILRLGEREESSFAELGKSSWAFPLVGALLGLMLVGISQLLQGLVPPLFRAATTVCLWIFLTGGLHLDGWVDCWDSLGAPVSPEQRLAILKDSRIGTFGAAALVSLFMLKVTALASDDFPSRMLVLAPVGARTIMLLVAHNAPHVENGMAACLINSLSPRSLMVACMISGLFILYAGLIGVIAFVCSYGAAIWFKRFAIKRLNVITGDVIGATCELSELIILVAACVRL